MINVKRFASVGAATPQPTMLDWATVESAIKAFGTPRDSRERRFQRYVLCSYFDKLLGDTEECITEGGNDRGIDCIVFDREQGVVHFISTKTATTFDRAKRNFPSSELEKLRSFIDDLLLQRKALLDSANAVLKGHVLQIWEELESGRRLRFHVHLFSNKLGLTLPDRDRFVEVLQRKEISFSEAHLVHIAKRVAHTIESPVRRQIRFIDDQRFEASYCGARIIEGIVRATDIVSLTRDPDDGNFDNRLLHHNVRYHLGNANHVNRNIIHALEGDHPDEFVLLNNGITLVCDRFAYQQGSNFPIAMDQPQIVNGGQTAYSLFSTANKLAQRLDGVRIHLRVIETRDEELVRRIAFATNSQSKILDRDLRANHDIAIKLAVGLGHQNFHYRRKRGDDRDVAPDRIIDAFRSGQLIISFLGGEPHSAKSSSDHIFGERFEDVFDPNKVTPDLLIALHRLFNEIERRKNREIAALRQLSNSDRYDEHWIVEGAFHVLWLAGELVDGGACAIVRAHTARSKIDRAIEIIDTYYTSLSRVSAYRVFRSAQTVERIRHFMRSRRKSSFAVGEQLELIPDVHRQQP